MGKETVDPPEGTDPPEGDDPKVEMGKFLRGIVDEALSDWTKANKPAPRRTDPEGEEKSNPFTVFESFFGKKV